MLATVVASWSKRSNRECILTLLSVLAADALEEIQLFLKVRLFALHQA